MPRASSSIRPDSRTKDKFTFFWTTSHIHGWASQWYPAPFIATVTIDGEEEQIEFPTTEHWMMLQKALLFSDIDIARQIKKSTSTEKREMKIVKALGRKVKNFDEEIWKANRRRIVLEGNLHKFRQNEALKEKLFETGDTEIAEASPRDRIWGIGFGEKNALSKFEKWGQNLLGKALGETRRLLREEQIQITGQD